MYKLDVGDGGYGSGWWKLINHVRTENPQIFAVRGEVDELLKLYNAKNVKGPYIEFKYEEDAMIFKLKFGL